MEACRRKKSFWAPYPKLFVRAIVNEDNPASGRVMDKVGMEKKGVYHWTGKAVFLAGKWQEKTVTVSHTATMLRTAFVSGAGISLSRFTSESNALASRQNI
ncbi:MAG: hypothetical protein Q9188_002089 [Gyalolechia gomerana]